MAINGIATVVYGVDDFSESVRFFEDFGLPLYKKTENFAHFKVAQGSSIHIRLLDDPWFQESKQMGIGVQECIWGVDTQESFDELLTDLRRDHEITVDADGVARFVTHFGQAIGFKVWTKKTYFSAPSPSNSPGRVNRVNELRKWIRRAIPSNIQHVVWSFPDVNETMDFYRDRLGFKLSDVQIGVGVYLRGGGAQEHHNIFIADATSKVLGFDGTIRFHHVNFGVEDIDELMVGKIYVERRGWPKSSWGLGRHRISSGAFLYLKCPAGGEAEYGADIDVLDDRWVPRIWEASFGSNIFMHNLPVFLQEEVEWNIGFCEPTAKYPVTALATEEHSETVESGVQPKVIMS